MKNGNISLTTKLIKEKESLEEIVKTARGKSGQLIVGDSVETFKYNLSDCCNPIPGDKVFGFITEEEIKIHRVNCPNAIQLMSNYSYQVVRAKWTDHELLTFLVGLRLTGIDEIGMVNSITTVISSELNVNIRSMNFESTDGIFEGNIMVYVDNTLHLDSMIKKLKKIVGMDTVLRLDVK